MRTTRVWPPAGSRGWGPATEEAVLTVLAGRYRLTGIIGTGASGQVFAAWDARLRRRVAVKVLHPGLAGDAGFLRRFRAEAQMAASLHHPNIVTVFDWGSGPGDEAAGTGPGRPAGPVVPEYQDLPFIVLELLSGGSLRALLDSGARLTPPQAVALGRQVTAALAYAHGRGLVHRDVKPANLLLDERGTVKVADFGLVRALADASWTEPAGTLLGTVRYAAPEQVDGRADARSDQYSLALVLVEAVTGTVPFAAETSLSTLMSRIDQRLAVPAALGPMVPVLERAGAPDPAARWPDAAAFGAALAELAGQLPPPEPFPLAGISAPGADPDPTQVHPPAVATARQPVPGSPPRGDPRAPPPKSVARTRPRRLILPVVVVALLVAGLGGALFAAGRAAGTPARIPNLVSLPEATARETAARAGFEVRVSRAPADDPAGTVLDHDPPAGTLSSEGHAVRLVVSSGPPPVVLPDVGRRPVTEARAELDRAGFEVTTSQAADEEVARGSVVSQEPPAGKAVPPGSRVRLVISDGPRPVEVPDVTGRSFPDAVRVLSAARLAATRVDEFSDDVDAGEVIRSDPPAGIDAPRDSAVKLVVSRGPDVVEVPDVRGEDLDEAIEILEESGFEVDVFGYGRGRSVKRQDPSPGKSLRRGGTVTLLF